MAGKLLNNYRGAVLMVTHDRYFLDRVTNRIFELSFGKLYEYKGNYETYVMEKAERERVAVEQEEKENASSNKNLRGCEQAFKHEERNNKQELIGFRI